MNSFIPALRTGHVLLMDGAMGTELQRLTQSHSFASYERFNLTHPDLVRSVHRGYLDAGAQVLLTNTFQANPIALRRQNLAEQHHEIWQTALRLAREVAGKTALVLADIGPIESVTADLVSCLLSECRGADGILLETWSSLEALRQFAAGRNEADPPLLVSFTFHRDNAQHELRTFADVPPEECARAAMAVRAVAVGANCGKDIRMADMLELVRRYRSVCALPLFVRPNAGTPALAESGWIYPHGCQAMAAALPALLQAGVAMVGGCCGTTPEYIRAFHEVIANVNAEREA